MPKYNLSYNYEFEGKDVIEAATEQEARDKFRAKYGYCSCPDELDGQQWERLNCEPADEAIRGGQ